MFNGRRQPLRAWILPFSWRRSNSSRAIWLPIRRETQDRFIEPSADRWACRLLWGRSGQFRPGPFVPCRHVSSQIGLSIGKRKRVTKERAI